MTSYPIGSTVLLQNLIAGASFNGSKGIVQSNVDATSLRQNVFVIGHDKQLAIKPANMKLCDGQMKADEGIGGDINGGQDHDGGVSSMSVRDLKAELQSYNICTDSYLDKTSLVEAVKNARKAGWRIPEVISGGAKASSAAASSSTSSKRDSTNGNGNQNQFASASKNTNGNDESNYSNGYPNKKQRGNSSSTNKSSKKDNANNMPIDLPQVALAKTWNESLNVQGWYLSEKLDGMRCIWDGNKGQMLSRNGNIIPAPTFFTNALPKCVVLDGELFLDRGEFQMCMSIAKQSDVNDWKQLTLVVFDAPLIRGEFQTRLKHAKDALARNNVDTSIARILGQTVCRGHDHVVEELQRITRIGGEGVMLRQPTAHYKGGRVSDLLKVKEFFDAEAQVVGYEEGKGRHAGRLGSIVCEMINNDSNTSSKRLQFKVGSGFSDVEREWENVPSIGSTITYRYFELTNGGKPRFPTFVRARPSE